MVGRDSPDTTRGVDMSTTQTPVRADRCARVDLLCIDQSCPVNVSAIEIEQALVSVIRNAIESREEGPP